MKNDVHDIKKLKKKFKKAVYSPKNSIQELREEYESIFYSPHLPTYADITEKEFKGIKTDVIHPEFAILGKAILYAHGGSFISGSAKAYRNLCASISHEAAAELYLPDYRLAPEYPFPTALEDLYNAYARIIETEKIAPGNFVLAGDGAGAGLALSLIHYLKSKKLPLPLLVVLLSPWADLTCKNENLNNYRKRDFIFSKDALFGAAHQYTYENNLENELVSPIFGDFKGFPPVFIQCGEDEILLADAELLKQKIESAGGTAELDVHEDAAHLFQALPDYFEKAQGAVEKIGRRIRESFDGGDE